jgi:AbiU2
MGQVNGRCSEPNMFEHMTTAERIQAAKEKTERVVDHLLYLLALHENNAIIVYSDTLSSQIRYLHAANAFDVFRAGLHQFEIVRMCALWDRAGDDKENIPTIIELIDLPEVIEALAQETLGHWTGIGGHIMNPSENPALRALEAECLQRHNEEFGQQEAQKARDGLGKAIADARAILGSPSLSSIMNLRHKHLAHSLTETKLEKKAGPIPPMKYGDERKILLASLPIVEGLHCWVNGKSFSFANSQEIDRNNAEALWKRCTFDVQR